MGQDIVTGVQNMQIKYYQNLYGDKPGRFHIAQCNYVIPLWVEKIFLKKLRSKKFRHIKKRMKLKIMEAVKRGMNYDVTRRKN